MITVIGAGKVGSQAAFNILRYKKGDDVLLIDTNENLVRGEALDMVQAAPEIEFDGKITGTNRFEDMQGSELVIVAAGFGRKPGMTRIDLMLSNAKIMISIAKNISKYAPEAKIMMVSNPVDILTYLMYKLTNVPRNHIFGMGNILDAMRFRTYIALQCNVSREDTRAMVIGEHGETMVPLVEYASVTGIPITCLLSQEQIATAVQQTINSGKDVIQLKGATTYAPGIVIAVMADAVLAGRNRVLSTTTPLNGEYGLSDLSIGVPAILGKNGVEKILELELTKESQVALEKSAQAIKASLATLRETLKESHV